MNIVKSSALLIAGFVSVACMTAPARAASPLTESFLANVMPNVDFLDRSSRMALDNSKSVRVKEFAHNQAAQQTVAANALYDVTKGAPAAMEQLQTGRSVALDGHQAVAADNRLPLGQEDLDSIEGLTGIEFDEAFRAKQRDALNQIKTDYETYLARGDDPALKAIAAKELPLVKDKIAALAKV